jgi:outer membrane protein assembly factor BamB
MPVAVLTRSYDNTRSGANTQETTLTPAAVTAGLQRRFSLQLTGDDPRLEAQPLIVPGVRLKNGETHDVAYVCTMGNNVWAFDANDGSLLWKTPAPLGPSIRGTKDIDMWLVNIRWGILGTPVIDPDTQTLYLVTWSLQDGSATDSVKPSGPTNNTVHRLHALDITDGSPRREPLVIAASVPAQQGPPVEFQSYRQKQRSALMLLPPRAGNGAAGKKVLFMACGQFGETSPGRHGWVIAFDVDAFAQTAAFCTTPNGSGGGVWQAGQGPSADADGMVYFMTGNGSRKGQTDFGQSFVKLKYTPPATPGGQARLDVADWFTPFRDKDRGHMPSNVRGVNFEDQDLGSASPLVLEGLGIVLGAGKDGVLYVLDKNNLGQDFRDFGDPHSLPVLTKLKSAPLFFTFFPGFGVDATDLTVLDEFVVNQQIHPARDMTHHLHHSPVFWESADHGPMVFCWGENENLRAWDIDATGKVTFLAKGRETASAGMPNPGGMPGGLLCLSANGKGDGVVWATAPLNDNANQKPVEGVLYAYDATDFQPGPGGTLKLLWSSKQSGTTFTLSKFCPPVVANGKVYVTTYEGRVDVFAP